MRDIKGKCKRCGSTIFIWETAEVDDGICNSVHCDVITSVKIVRYFIFFILTLFLTNMLLRV